MGTESTLSPDAWPRLWWPTLVLRAQAWGSPFGNRDTHAGNLIQSNRNQSFSLWIVKSCLASSSKGTPERLWLWAVGPTSAHSFHFIFPLHVAHKLLNIWAISCNCFYPLRLLSISNIWWMDGNLFPGKPLSKCLPVWSSNQSHPRNG